MLLACALALCPALASASDAAPVVPIGSVDLTLVEPSGVGAMASGGDSFADPEAEPVDPTGGSAAEPAVMGEASERDDLQDLTAAQLRRLHARLVRERDAARGRLVRSEIARSAAEERLDIAIAAWSRQLVAAYDTGSSARLQSLVGIREAAGAEQRAARIAALGPVDRAVVVEHDAASTTLDRSVAVAEAARAAVLALDTRLDEASLALELAAPATAEELVRARGARSAVDVDLIFATGPIPGIGYWGAVSGGGMLSGWMGYAGAAVGGVGCTAPDPALQASGSTEQGGASWYGPGFDGRATASGEVYDQTALTAAHRTLPIGTIVRVYSTTTARCAFVRINDRGPFVDGRIIDLSRAAADAIGIDGVAPVQIEAWTVAGAPPTPAA